MGSFFSGKQKSTTTSNSTQTPTFPDWLSSVMQSTVGSAAGLASQPYTPYIGERVAGLSADEQAAFDLVRGLAGSTQGAYQQAQDITGQVAQRGLEGYTTEQLQRYMNPYQEAVMDISKRRQLEQFDKAKRDLMAQKASIGAFGGSRTGLAEQELYSNMAQQLADTEAQQLYAGYNTALNQAMQGTATAGNAAGQIASLASAGQQTGLQGASALQSAGQTQRALSQAGLDVGYQDYLTAQQYPYQQLEFLSGITNPIAQLNQGQTGSSTSTTTSKSTPSLASTLVGLGSMALGGPLAGMAGGLMGGAMGGLGLGSSLATSFGNLLPNAAQGAFMQGYGFQGPLQANGRFEDGGQVTFKEGDKIAFIDVASALALLEDMNDRPKGKGSKVPPSIADLYNEDMMIYENNDFISKNSPELAKELAKGQAYIDATADLPASQKEYLDNLLKAWADEGITTNLSPGYICGGKVKKYADGGLASRFGSSLADVVGFRQPFRNYLKQQNQNAMELFQTDKIAKWIVENPGEAAGLALMAPEAAGLAGLSVAGTKLGVKALPSAIKTLVSKSPKLAKALRYGTAAGLALGNDNKEVVKPITETDQKVEDILAQIAPNAMKTEKQKEQAVTTKETPKMPEEKDNFNAPLFMFGASLLSSGGKNFFEALGDAGKAYATVKLSKEEAIRKAAKEALDRTLEERRVAAYERQSATAEAAAQDKRTLNSLRMAKMQRDMEQDPTYKKMISMALQNGASEEELIQMSNTYQAMNSGKSLSNPSLEASYNQIPTGTPRTEPPSLQAFMGMR
jgi:hypothetical protein